MGSNQNPRLSFKIISTHCDLSEQTEKQYKSQLNILSDIFVLKDIFERPEFVISKLKSLYTLATMKTYLNVIIVYIRSTIDEIIAGGQVSDLVKTLEIYRTEWKTHQKNYEKEVAEGHMTDKQKKMFMTTAEFDVLIMKAIDKFGESSEEVLMLKLYRHAPVRSDYAVLRISLAPSDGHVASIRNWYHHPSSQMILNDYKTVKFYGTLKFKVSEDLKLAIDKYMVVKMLEDGDYFFSKKDGTPVSKNLFGKRIKTIFKKLGVEHPPNIQMLRHIYLMNKYGSIKKEMKDDAIMMGHSLDTQGNYILTYD
jgi:hypothetical protein